MEADHKRMSMEEEIKRTQVDLQSTRGKLERLEKQYTMEKTQLRHEIEQYRSLYDGVKSTVKNVERYEGSETARVAGSLTIC